jgi:lambda repressor-like predicted transcriptional regulator
VHPADIHASLKKAGATQMSVARGLGITHGAVYLVMQGATKSARIARRISEVTGIPVAQLWPGRYPLLEAEQRGNALALQARAAAEKTVRAAAANRPHKRKAA